MSASFFVLSRVPRMGSRTLHESRTKSVRQARDWLKFLFSFLHVIQLYPAAVYAKHKPRAIEHRDDRADLMLVLLEVPMDATAAALRQVGTHEVEFWYHTSLYHCPEVTQDRIKSMGLSLVNYSRPLCIEFKENRPQLMEMLQKIRRSLNYHGRLATVDKPPSSVQSFVDYTPSEALQPLSSSSDPIPSTSRPPKRSPSVENDGGPNRKRSRIESPLLINDTVLDISLSTTEVQDREVVDVETRILNVEEAAPPSGCATVIAAS